MGWYGGAGRGAAGSGGARSTSVDLREAIDAGQLVVVFQPIIDLDRGMVTGAEALVRWPDPAGRLRDPATFVPLAEDEGLIQSLGASVLDQALRAARRWEPMVPGFEMCVNVSPFQLEPDLVVEVDRALGRTGWDPHQLVLEVTESAELGAGAVAVAHQLKGLGVQISLDDFGTGCSSLLHLDQLPVDVVKIDRYFTRQLDAGPRGRAVAAAVLGLAQTLGMGVVAEGIESGSQLVAARAMGCPAAQGYHFSRPLDAGAFDALLATRCRW